MTNADFPTNQRLAQNTNLTLSVRNTGEETIPDLAITIFTTSDESTAEGTSTTGEGTTTDGEPGTAGTTADQQLPRGERVLLGPLRAGGPRDPSRPVWILEEGYPRLAGQTSSAGAEAAQTNTFSFGALAPDETREMVWSDPGAAGDYTTVHYRIAAGLQGKAKASGGRESPRASSWSGSRTFHPRPESTNRAGSFRSSRATSSARLGAGSRSRSSTASSRLGRSRRRSNRRPGDNFGHQVGRIGVVIAVLGEPFPGPEVQRQSDHGLEPLGASAASRPPARSPAAPGAHRSFAHEAIERRVRAPISVQVAEHRPAVPIPAIQRAQHGADSANRILDLGGRPKSGSGCRSR